MKESLVKATHDLGFACDSLKAALDKATAVQRIALLEVIWRTKAALQDANALLKAIEADAMGTVKPKA